MTEIEFNFVELYNELCKLELFSLNLNSIYLLKIRPHFAQKRSPLLPPIAKEAYHCCTGLGS